MNAQEFCYWLQGFFEITEASSNRAPDGFTEGQARMIREHLALVFNKVTPQASPASDTYAWPPVGRSGLWPHANSQDADKG